MASYVVAVGWWSNQQLMVSSFEETTFGGGLRLFTVLMEGGLKSCDGDT